MSVTAKTLVNAAFAANSDTIVYTVPTGLRTIIDKFTATNTDGSSQTLNVNLIPSSGSVGDSNLIMDATSIATLATKDFTELQNQILSAGDKISVNASVASKIVVRASGREIS